MLITLASFVAINAICISICNAKRADSDDIARATWLSWSLSVKDVISLLSVIDFCIIAPSSTVARSNVTGLSLIDVHPG